MNPAIRPRAACRRATRERGSVLAVALVLLIALALAAISLVRSVDTSTLLARNASFQRDAVNRNEVVMRQAMQAFENDPARHFNSLANTDESVLGQASGFPYSAVALPTDPMGVPVVLRDSAAFGAQFGALSRSTVASGEGMTTTYVIDRLCSLEQPAEDTHCLVASARAPDNCSRCSMASTPFAPMFRITARTLGPRGTEAFSQVVFTLPMD
ncbi:MAG TPA: hypothetical protein VM491_08685 [Burkholderiaceae bacterium]|jgi:type IV pilus assembly protein PilX|nr:hypothetical protein [Burkholderiaceae bacterium]